MNKEEYNQVGSITRLKHRHDTDFYVRQTVLAAMWKMDLRGRGWLGDAYTDVSPCVPQFEKL